jgi:nucleotide-binding universal stress UspA family protein
MAAAANPEVTELHPDGGVLVGDDGSACAAAAVRAAAEEAVLRGVRLHVVRAWSITTAVRPDDVPQGIVPSSVEFEAATLAAERRRVAELLDGSAVDVEVHAVHAAPAKALIEAAASAELLVVGTRGRGGFKTLLLGSVAEQCLRHAPSNVLVVRD